MVRRIAPTWHHAAILRCLLACLLPFLLTCLMGFSAVDGAVGRTLGMVECARDSFLSSLLAGKNASWSADTWKRFRLWSSVTKASKSRVSVLACRFINVGHGRTSLWMSRIHFCFGMLPSLSETACSSCSSSPYCAGRCDIHILAC